MLSLDIENGGIRCVEGKKSGNQAVISGYFEVPIPNGTSLLNEGAPKKLGGLLKEEINIRRIRDRKCTASLRSADLFFRRITLPKAGAAQLKDMVSHAISGIFTAKDYYIDYTVEREFTENGKKKMEVLLCGAPKNLAEAYYSMIMAADLIPHRMDAQQNFIHSLLADGTSVNEITLHDKSVLLIDAGDSLISSDLIVDGKSVFERTSNVFSSVSDFYDGFEDLGMPSNGQAGEKSKVRTKIYDEAGKMLQFSLTKTAGKPVSEIFLYGENSADSAICGHLTSELDVKVSAVREVTGIKLEKSYDGPELCKILGLCAAII